MPDKRCTCSHNAYPVIDDASCMWHRRESVLVLVSFGCITLHHITCTSHICSHACNCRRTTWHVAAVMTGTCQSKHFCPSLPSGCLVNIMSYMSCHTSAAESLRPCSEPGRQAARHARGGDQPGARPRLAPGEAAPQLGAVPPQLWQHHRHPDRWVNLSHCNSAG